MTICRNLEAFLSTVHKAVPVANYSEEKYALVGIDRDHSGTRDSGRFSTFMWISSYPDDDMYYLFYLDICVV